MGLTEEEIHRVTSFDPWFLRQIAEIIAEETALKEQGVRYLHEHLHRLKMMGFSDKRLGQLTGFSAEAIGGLRAVTGTNPVYVLDL